MVVKYMKKFKKRINWLKVLIVSSIIVESLSLALIFFAPESVEINRITTDPFFTNFTSTDKTNSVYLKNNSFYNNSEHANQFYKTHQLMNEHQSNFDVFSNYLMYFNTFYDHYNEVQIKQLYLPIYTVLETIEFKEKDIKELGLVESTLPNNFKHNLYSSFYRLQKNKHNRNIQHTVIVETLKNRKNYLYNKYGISFKDHPLIDDFSAFVQNNFSTNTTTNLNNAQEKWPNSKVFEKNILIQSIEVSIESNQWVIELLKEKQAKSTNILLINFLLSNAVDHPENNNIVLAFIGINQRSPYITLTNKYLGYDVVEQYLESIN
ncbi:hypothetical protein TYM08_P0017 [Marinicellulosiphila megalodicopiae]